MAKERLKSPRARLFVALDIPDDVRLALAAWQAAAIDDPALRILAPETLHMTLAFLGYRPERQIEEIAALVTEVEAPAPRLEFLPEPVGRPRGRPRHYSLEARSEGAVDIHADVTRRLEEAGFYKPEKRRWSPHLTVARVRPEKGTKRPRRVEKPPQPLPTALEHVFYAVRLTFYRSHLRKQGAEYFPLAQKELPVGSSEVV
jgi:2'-5' RNA ligase